MQIIANILIFSGLFFFIVGTIGLFRFDDFLKRAHGAAKCDTLGAVLSLIGLCFYSNNIFVVFKLILVLVFLWITNPTATHLITNSNYESNKN